MMLDQGTESKLRSSTSWRLRALLSVAFGAVLLTGIAATAARAGDDDDEDRDSPSIERKVLNSVLNGLGVQPAPPIDYRERSPLVVPPKLDLPRPETTASIEKKAPNWPLDADVK